MPFYIENVQSGKYLDVKDECEDKGTEVILYDFTGNKNQQWKYKNGMIYSKLNGLVIDVKDEDQDGKLILWDPKESDNQKWHFDPDFTIRSGLGTVMDVQGGSTDSGTNIISFAKHGGDNQKFRIVPVNND